MRDQRDVYFPHLVSYRICPGKELAGASLFLCIATMAATFDISYAKDSEGKVVIPDGEYLNGVIR